MIDKYHSAVDELLPAELELMMPDIETVHLGLAPGHSRYKYFNDLFLILLLDRLKTSCMFIIG